MHLLGFRRFKTRQNFRFSFLGNGRHITYLRVTCRNSSLGMKKPFCIEKIQPEDHCDGRETSARLDSMFRSCFGNRSRRGRNFGRTSGRRKRLDFYRKRPKPAKLPQRFRSRPEGRHRRGRTGSGREPDRLRDLPTLPGTLPAARNIGLPGIRRLTKLGIDPRSITNFALWTFECGAASHSNLHGA